MEELKSQNSTAFHFTYISVIMTSNVLISVHGIPPSKMIISSQFLVHQSFVVTCVTETSDSTLNSPCSCGGWL